MIKVLVNLLISFLDLIEAEAVSARRGLVLFAFGLMLGLGAGLIALVALGMLIWALYILVTGEMSQVGALFLCGLILTCIAGASLWFAKRILL